MIANHNVIEEACSFVLDAIESVLDHGIESTVLLPEDLFFPMAINYNADLDADSFQLRHYKTYFTCKLHTGLKPTQILTLIGE